LAAAGDTATQQLVELLAASSTSREDIFEELEKMGDKAVSALLEALQDADYKVRMAAARSLGDLRDEAAVPALVASLSDSSKNVQRHAADALTSIGQPAVKPLLDALIGKDQSARRWAAEALGDIGDRSVALELVKRLNDPNGSTTPFFK